MLIPTFREVQGEITAMLRQQGYLAAILVDLAPLAHIEKSFGGAAFRSLRDQVDPLLQSMRENFRQDDFVTRDEREGDRFMLFLSGPRRGDTPFRSETLRKLVGRVEEYLNPRVGRLTLPYLRERPVLVAGYGVVLWSPLESPERQILRLVDDAAACALMRVRIRERDQRERLFEIIQNREIWTAFQPIVELQKGHVVAWEGLSRGPRGSDVELPMVLFGQAARYGMTEELERACRRQAFVDWHVLARKERLFINTVPATVRDTSFLGRGVLEYLGPDLAPSAVTLEITERQVIENLNIYREAMHSFTDLGFSFAIDDVGAGYSGLETVATLKPAYLKIDIALVRDVHQKKVSQQVVKAILDMSVGLGATVIAEGIQAREEVEALRELGVPWGQGYFYARPVDPYAAASRRPLTRADDAARARHSLPAAGGPGAATLRLRRRLVRSQHRRHHPAADAARRQRFESLQRGARGAARGGRRPGQGSGVEGRRARLRRARPARVPRAAPDRARGYRLRTGRWCSRSVGRGGAPLRRHRAHHRQRRVGARQ